MKDEIKNTAASAADEAKAGYKHPPVKNRLSRFRIINHFCRYLSTCRIARTDVLFRFLFTIITKGTPPLRQRHTPNSQSTNWRSITG
jgi:hypothetical protein